MGIHTILVEMFTGLRQSLSRQGSRDSSQAEKGIVDENGRVRAPDLLDGAAGGVQYKSMVWWHVGMLMIAETISLGILSLPSAVARLGLIPGLLLVPGLGLLATYSGFVIGQFKLAHPSVLNFADAGEILFGTVGRHIFGWGAILSFVFIQAAHILTFSVMMNVLTGHSACSILWGIVGTIISIILTIPRTLKNVSYISIVAFISIVISVMIVMISVGVANNGGIAVDYIVTSGSFTSMFVGYLDIMLAYAGNAAFFGFVSELKDPKTYPKALFLLQGTAITFYTVVAALIYYFVGRHVDSPALGAAGPLVRKIAYGVALPTIVVAGVINGHVAAKMVYVSVWAILKKPSTITQKTREAYLSWAAIVAVLWFIAWILAEAIPIFNELLGLMSALFMSWFTLGLSGMLWFYLNKDGKWRSGPGKLALAVLNACMILIALFSCIVGLYASGKEISNASKTGIGKAFSCDNNDPKAAAAAAAGVH